jgi:hypothetical protein
MQGHNKIAVYYRAIALNASICSFYIYNIVGLKKGNVFFIELKNKYFTILYEYTC